MKLTIELSESEYAELCRRAAADRRTPEQMAERLVTQPQPITFPHVCPPLPVYPWQPTVINTWPFRQDPWRDKIWCKTYEGSAAGAAATPGNMLMDGQVKSEEVVPY